ncbi:MAG: hypothetical protein KDE34_07605 [Anaerolineales bacterium]|nr:hypothetical protein [Anaerolineales bacterium]
MNIYLAGLGWLTDAPAGNRLRWHYPVDALAGAGDFLGLPDVIIVERAWLNEDLPQPAKLAGGAGEPLVPIAWWDHHGDVTPIGFLPLVYQLSDPVQAVRFVYRGGKARLLVKDSVTGRTVADQMLVDGQTVLVQAPGFDRLQLYAASGLFENFQSLDLFADRGLRWRPLARIKVAATVGAELDEVALRYDNPPTLTAAEWAELVEGVAQASLSTLATIKEGEPTPWESVSLVLGLRWEHALLFGHGFFDGPRQELPTINEIVEDNLLTTVPAQAVAYRVREEKKRVGPSNLVVCPPWLIPPLTAPGQPVFVKPEVRLRLNVETEQPEFEATYGLRWQQADALALGVAVEEEIGPSPVTGAAGEVLAYQSRSNRPEDPPMQGEVTRSITPAFHDVELRARAQATDGWDRVSGFSRRTPWTALSLVHEPAPPAFTAARHNAGQARLTRQYNDPNFPNWQPDLVIQHDATAKLYVYRRKAGTAGQPRAATGTAATPEWVSGDRYKTTISGVTNLHEFLAGTLNAAPFKATIRQVSGNDVYFDRLDSTIFLAGPVKLRQDPLALALWQKVAEFDAHTLPAELVFADPVPPPTATADVLSYHARLHFLGRLGPPSNTVQALRLPVTPAVPPPFSVALLGVDFYNRTMVKIRFTNPVSDGLYTIWWAAGSLTATQFESKAVPGEQRAQQPYLNRYLFDNLAIPLPQTASRTITIGVQQVLAGGGQSAFKVVPVTLPALIASP